jgi:hypothetical protein
MPRLFNSLNEQYIRNYVAKIITMKESYKILLPYFFIQQNTPLPPNPSSKVGYRLTNVKPKAAIRQGSNMSIPLFLHPLE